MKNKSEKSFGLKKSLNYICDMDLKKEIKDKGLKQVWIADKIGMKKSLFHHYLNGYKNMSFPKEVESKIIELIS